MRKLITQFAVMKALDWAYQKTLNGVPGLASVDELAQKHMLTQGDLTDKANSLIRWQNAKAGTSGFITGIGGFMTLPVAIPANMASVLYIQIRMISAIALMGGYNLRDEKVKTMVYLCLVGNFAKDILQESAIKIGTRFTTQAVKSISEHTLMAVNQKVGFRLLTTYSGKGAVNLCKAVPLAGGLIGGAIDTVATNIIGTTARKLFIDSGK